MRAHVIVPEELVKEVDVLVGSRGRSKFFVEAVEEKLRRERRVRLFDALAGSGEGNEWDETDSVEWVRRLREDSDRRIDQLWGEIPEGSGLHVADR